jgi:hypothetical protein
MNTTDYDGFPPVTEIKPFSVSLADPGGVQTPKPCRANPILTGT